VSATVNRQNVYNISDQTKQAESLLNESPAFQFSVLTSPHHYATKIIYGDGREIGYDKPKFFKYKYCEVDCLEDFEKLVLGWLVTHPHSFIIRGQLKPGLIGLQRRLLYPKDGYPATIECPPRRWIVLDIDDAIVPPGVGAPDKMAQAGYHIRDCLLPTYFRGVRCIAAATSGTGRKGKVTARLRLFFVLSEAADNEALRLWVTGLSEKYKWIDDRVMLAMQPIYTARPIFRGCVDPVPEWGRVRMLDGVEDVLTLDLPKLRRPKRYEERLPVLLAVPTLGDFPEGMLEATEGDAGLGVHPVEEVSDKAWQSIRYIFEELDGCPKNGKGRHVTLNSAAWQLARLVAECELIRPNGSIGPASTRANFAKSPKDFSTLHRIFIETFASR
jgi:hypothetical protein